MTFYAHVPTIPGFVVEPPRDFGDLVLGRDILTPDLAATWHPCDATVCEGWKYDGTSFEAAVIWLSDLQAMKAAEIDGACAAEIVGGYLSSALGTPHTYPSKPNDQTNMLGSVLGSLLPSTPAGWTTPFWVADTTGTWSFKDHTAAQIQQAGFDGKYAVAVAQVKNATLQAKIIAATTADGLAAIVW